MRTWRVGTVSMGLSLLFLGVFLLLSQFFGYQLFQIMAAWWPIILVVLGIEILAYLYVSRQEKPYVKYDILSIFFVGIIGMTGIGFAILSTTGIMDKVQDYISREERSEALPGLSKSLGEKIERIVIETEQYPITVEGTNEKTLSMFGSYRALSGKKNLLAAPDDYALIEEKGDTLYVSVKGLPNEMGPFNHYSSLSATILVPLDVKLEVLGNGNPIKVKPRLLLSDWSVEGASDVSVYLQKNSDVLLSAVGANELSGEAGDWEIVEDNGVMPKDKSGNDAAVEVHADGLKDATYKLGKGSHQLQIFNAYNINLTTIQ